jgi:hypothetical protein
MGYTQPIPSGPLTDWLRAEALKPFDPPRGDQGDQVALQWLTYVPTEGDELTRRLASAVEALLGDGDPQIAERVIEVTPQLPPTIRSAVARAVGKHAIQLQTMPRPVLSFLGAAVHGLQGGRLAEPLPPETLDRLLTIDSLRDGWPVSVELGLLARDPRFLDVLVQAVERMSDSQLDNMLLGLLNEQGVGGHAAEASLERIGSEAGTAMRARVGEAVQRVLNHIAGRREMLIRDMGITLPPRDPVGVEWPRHAKRLGVPA